MSRLIFVCCVVLAVLIVAFSAGCVPYRFHAEVLVTPLNQTNPQNEFSTKTGEQNGNEPHQTRKRPEKQTGTDERTGSPGPTGPPEHSPGGVR
jgi:hypothetical protein